MNTRTDARIFLADQRGQSETGLVRSFHTFHFGQYRAEGREPFGALTLLNDDTLLVGASLAWAVERDTTVLLLPVTGGLEYAVDETIDFLEPGQAGVLHLRAGAAYTVANPYETETIHVLQLWLTSEVPNFAPGVRAVPFDLKQTNALLPLLASTAGRVYLGRYDGRAEGTHAVAAGTGLFVFVLNGVFGVANRLLHDRDGLALRYPEAGKLEFEALSNGAVLLVVEVTA
jgi:hypothetical protein